MPENTPNTPSNTNPPSDDSRKDQELKPQPKRKKKHRILKTLALLLILLVLLIVFAPTLLSMGWARNLVLGQVNKQLNGHVTIANWSFGWLSNIELSGIKVTTADGEIASVASVKTNLAVMQAAQMARKMDFSGIVATVTDPYARVIVDDKGQVNFAGLMKQGEGAPGTAAAPSRPPSKLPNFSNITLKVVNAKANIQQAEMEKVVATVPTFDLTIEDINKPIKTNLTAKVVIGSRKEGTITVAGTVDAIEGNLVDVDHISADQKITWADLDLGAAAPFLAAHLSHLKGVNNGSLTLSVQNGRQVALAMNSAGPLDAAPKALEGDAFVTSNLKITIPQSTVDLPGGLGDWQNAVLHVGDEANPIVITFDHGKVTAFANAPLKAVLNAMKQSPGFEGQIGTDVDVRLDQLAKTMPKTIRLMEGWKLTEASLNQTTRIGLKPEFLTVTQHVKVPDIRVTDPKGQPQTLAGAEFNLSATSYGMSGAMPDLRDIVLNLDTIAGKIDITAKNLASPVGKGALELKKFNEYAKVFNLPVSFESGMLTLAFSSKGQFLQAGDTVEPSGSFKLTDLAATVKSADGKQQWAFNEPLIDLSGTATMLHGTKNLIEKITGGSFAVRVGAEANPLVDVAGKLTDAAVLTPAIKAPFALSKARIQVAELQQRYGKFMKPLEDMGLKFEKGTVNADNTTGSLDGSTIKIATAVRTTEIRLVKAGSPQPIVNNFGSQIDLTAQVDMTKGIHATVSKLDVKQDNSKYSIQLPAGATLAVDIPEKGPISIKGPLKVDADLQWAGDRASLFMGQNPRSKAGDVQTGMLAMTLDFAGDGISPKGTLNITKLSFRTPDNQASKEQDLSGPFDVVVAGDFSSATVKLVDLKGLVNAKIEDTLIVLSSVGKDGKPLTPSLWDMVPRANVQISSDNIKPLIDLMSAFMPASPPVAVRLDTRVQLAQAVRIPPAAAAAAAGDPFALSNIQRGKIAMNLNVARQQDQTVVKITKLTVNDLVIKNGNAPQYVLPPIDLTLDAAIAAAADPAKPDQPLMEQIKSITVNTLKGSAGVADLSMPEKIVLTDLAGTPKASGLIVLKGAVARVIELVNLFQGAAPADQLAGTGEFNFTQKLKTQNNAIAAEGDGVFSELDVRRGKQQLLREDRLTIKNDLSYDTQKQNAGGTVKLDMASSKALSVDFAGMIDDLKTRRAIRDKATLVVRGDYAKLLELGKAFLTKEQVDSFLKDAKLGGMLNETYTVTGSFPADKPFNEAIKFLHLIGGIGIDSFEATGAVGQKFGLDLKLANGMLTTSNRFGNETATVNGGGLNLAGIQVDLTGSSPLVTMPDNLQLARDLKTTPVLLKALDVASILDSQHPALLNVKVISCQKLPIGDLMGKKNPGQLKVTYRLDDVQLGGGVFNALRAVDVLGDNSSDLRGQMTGEATIANGFFTIPNLTVATGAKDRPLFTLSGKAALDEVGKLDFKASLVTTYIKAVQKQKELAKWMPDYVSFGITGPRAAPKVDAGHIVSDLVTEAIKKRAIGQFLPQPKDEPTPKDEPKPKDPKPKDPKKKPNPLDDILKGLGGDKK